MWYQPAVEASSGAAVVADAVEAVAVHNMQCLFHIVDSCEFAAKYKLIVKWFLNNTQMIIYTFFCEIHIYKNNSKIEPLTFITHYLF